MHELVATGGVLYAAEVADDRQYRFRTLLRAVTDDLDKLLPAAESGLYVVFPMIRRLDLTHVECDRYWRYTHAPLALKRHPGLRDYTQLSVLATLAGEPYDGFALAAFASLDDMREHMFGDDNYRAVILNDMAKFADLKRPAPQLITTERVFGHRPAN